MLGDTGALRESAQHPVRRPGLARWFREWARLEGEAISLYTHAECVEVAACPDAIHVRDSKDKAGPQLTFTPDAWSNFVAFARQF